MSKTSGEMQTERKRPRKNPVRAGKPRKAQLEGKSDRERMGKRKQEKKKKEELRASWRKQQNKVSNKETKFLSERQRRG